jgi:hypothetical protein
MKGGEVLGREIVLDASDYHNRSGSAVCDGSRIPDASGAD